MSKQVRRAAHRKDDRDAALEPDTIRTINAIKEVYDHNVESLEAQVGRLVIAELPRFLGSLNDLPSERDRRAAIYLLVEEVRRTFSQLRTAVRFFPGHPKA